MAVKMKKWNDCTLAEQIKRWEEARQTLRDMTPHERRSHWDMTAWGYETECGTVACAAGQCGMRPWFRRRGFKLTPASRLGYGSIGKFTGGRNAPRSFFGVDGAERIFYDTFPRPVSTVIKEMTAYINELRSQA